VSAFSMTRMQNLDAKSDYSGWPKRRTTEPAPRALV
jgi:hypothetical protein